VLLFGPTLAIRRLAREIIDQSYCHKVIGRWII
jgi:hypothetical protein